VGIGVSTVSGKLHLSESGATNAAATIFSLDGYHSTFGANLAKSSGTYTTPAVSLSGGAWEYQPVNSLNGHGTMIYLSAPDTNSSASTPLERLRIDVLGRFMVGKTSTGLGNVGVELDPDGQLKGTAANVVVQYLNRTSSDGSILEFRKDNSTVGSIGSRSGSHVYVALSPSGLANAGLTAGTASGSNTIFPTDSSGSTRDGSVDLGWSGGRFKDLYLSNSVNITTATNGTSIIDLGDTADSNIGRIAYDNSVDAMYFKTNNSERLRITSDGSVGIGTSSPTSNTTHIAFRRSTFDRTQIVIGHSDTSSRTVVNFFANGTQGGSINTSPTATSYNTSSDYRLKENVTATWDATTRLKQLNPVRFNFIADPDTTVDGFLAHQVQDIVPEAITGTKDQVDDDGNAVMQGIDQSKLVPLLVKTIQELEARIAALEAN
jgi:hypothetical protein